MAPIGLKRASTIRARARVGHYGATTGDRQLAITRSWSGQLMATARCKRTMRIAPSSQVQAASTRSLCTSRNHSPRDSRLWGARACSVLVIAFCDHELLRDAVDQPIARASFRMRELFPAGCRKLQAGGNAAFDHLIRQRQGAAGIRFDRIHRTLGCFEPDQCLCRGEIMRSEARIRCRGVCVKRLACVPLRLPPSA